MDQGAVLWLGVDGECPLQQFQPLFHAGETKKARVLFPRRDTACVKSHAAGGKVKNAKPSDSNSTSTTALVGQSGEIRRGGTAIPDPRTVDR